MLNRSFLLDSSAWISYLMGERAEVRKIFDSEDFIHTSILSFYEVRKMLLKKGMPKEEVAEALDIMRRRSATLELTEDICEKAALDSIKHGFYSVDSLIYASACKAQATFVTTDKDFRKKRPPNILYIER